MGGEDERGGAWDGDPLGKDWCSGGQSSGCSLCLGQSG
jgi:hypothetical protein